MSISKIDLILDDLKGNHVLLAHSGGVDSCVLAEIFINKKINFSVAHCNFKLRDKESDEDLKFVKNWCIENNTPFYFKVFDVKGYIIVNKKSIQEAARDLRYEWFNSLMVDLEIDILATAHHLNDQLETFLINSIRGTGISGLLGIKETNKIIRPLNTISKKDILNYARKHKIEWREDSSNAKNDYFRNKIRHQVVSPLEQIKPEALENFKTTLKNLSQAERFIFNQLDGLKNKIFRDDGETIYVDIEHLIKQKPINFILHHLFTPFGFEAKEVEKLLNANSGKVLLSNSFRLIRDRKQLLISHINKENNSPIIIDLEGKNNKLPFGLEFKVGKQTQKKNIWKSYEAFLDKDLLKNPLYIRKYSKGDYFYPSGMKGKKLLSKFFKDEKYSLLEKEKQWLLFSRNKIVWVVGRRCDERFIANEQTKNKLLLRLTK